MKDDTCYPEIPPSSFHVELEKRLSPICIQKDKCQPILHNYGTKTHTIITIDQNDILTFIEVERHEQDENGAFEISENRVEHSEKLKISLNCI